jgi:ribulose-5-phosphate 4-epimerase/fuculose-1-phosphate aldolase
VVTAAETRELAVRANNSLAAAGQSDMVWGHAAVRDPDGRGIWIKAPGWGFEEIDDDRVQLVSFDAEVLEGEGKPHKECHIHLEVLRARPELRCSVHTHGRSAVAFAALDTPLLPISHDATIFAGEDAPRFTLTGGLITTPELGRAVAETLGEAPAALLPKHGLVAAGTSVQAAVMHAVLLDRACRTQLAAMAAGPIKVWSDAAEATAKREECWAASQIDAGWAYLDRKAKADREAGRGTGRGAGHRP